MTTNQRIGFGLAATGLLLLLTVVGLYLWSQYGPHAALPSPATLPWFGTLIAAGLMYWGFAWANPKRARQNGDDLLDLAERGEQLRPGGRRKGDPKVVPVQPDRAEAVGHE